MNTLCIDIGGTKFSVGAIQGESLILRETRRTNRDGGPAWLMEQLDQIAGTWRQQGFEAHRCGIGFGGPFNFANQTVTMSTHVGGWAGFPLVDSVRALTKSPVVADNDANAGALGEARYGAGRGLDPLFYMTVSTGIGGGICHEGKIYRGADSFGGEIGHMNVEPNGPECLCGSNGCLERMCCGLWLERDFGRPAIQLFEDPEFVRRYVVHLARGLKAGIMILNPARLIIGGGISKAGARLFDPLREELARQMPAWSRARRDVVPAELGDDSILYGALALASIHL